MNDIERPRGDARSSRQLTEEELAVWSALSYRTNRWNIRVRKIVGLVIWTATLIVVITLLTTRPDYVSVDGNGTEIYCRTVLDAGPSDPACSGFYAEFIGQSLIVALVGLVAGTIAYVSGRREASR